MCLSSSATASAAKYKRRLLRWRWLGEAGAALNDRLKTDFLTKYGKWPRNRRAATVAVLGVCVIGHERGK